MTRTVRSASAAGASRGADAARARGRAMLAAFAPIGSPARLLLAGKAAFAAVLAWYLAPLVPFTDDQYSYYAPLGVLVTMYPTVARSAHSGAQTLAGLALGVGIGLVGLAIVFAGWPGGVALAAVILVGVLLGGVGVLGVGRDWVALAALFVLLVGGRDLADFSVSYLVTTGVGVVVGIVVNLVVVPPLYVRRASGRLSVLRDALAAQLRAMADAVAATDVDPESLQRELDLFAETMDAVGDDVREARESGTVNPRGRRHRGELDENDARLRGLELSWRYTRELADVIERLHAVDGLRGEPARTRLAEATAAVAEVVGTPVGDPAAAERLDAAVGAVERLRETAPVGDGRGADEPTAAVIFLHRIIDGCRPFV
ncbi:FUSC family protein [Microbacterium sp. W1N]|uniref:FUSC family protein n=1 Tax=Microbacterium festucae TaxID=2977531 RepID=UPI0021C1F9E1|nr:FUSC family protein [Microbacterium festucae]MCT9818671.1 FUSC family protein [Microbacterium festucae]